MKYFVFETTMVPGAYKEPGFKEALAGHMAFVKQQFADGMILFSGTKLDNSGGVRVIQIADDANVEEFWKADPMTMVGMLNYRVTAFNPLDISSCVSGWFC